MKDSNEKMKNEKLTGTKVFSREELRNIRGGSDGYYGGPEAPTGTNDGSGGGRGYKCCWRDSPNSCSECVEQATSSWTCVSGADLTAC